jgi:hypothetical protein
MRYRLTLIVFITAILLTGCTQQSHQPHDVSDLEEIRKLENEEKYSSVDFLEEQNVNPISDHDFFSAEGWLDEQNILYLSENAEKSTVYKYNLFTGEKEKLYESNSSIVQLEISPKRNLILVHASPSSYEAEVIIIDQSGNEQTKRTFPSSEVTYSWSPNGDRVFLTSFDEDWSYQTFILNLKDFSLEKNPVDIPFIQWLSEEEITYLMWDEGEPQLTAPLYRKSLIDHKEVMVGEQMINHANLGDYSFAVQVKDEEESIGSYSFYLEKYDKLIYSFDVQLLPLYSEWLIPHFDYSDRNKLFYTFVPGAEENKFNLTAIDPKAKKASVILENADNSDIMISPSGEFALYGSYLENVIDLKEAEIKSIVE